jgi:hypothetical protein
MTSLLVAAAVAQQSWSWLRPERPRARGSKRVTRAGNNLELPFYEESAPGDPASLAQGICLVGRRIPFIKLDQQLAHITQIGHGEIRQPMHYWLWLTSPNAHGT